MTEKKTSLKHRERNKRYLDSLDEIKIRVPKGQKEIMKGIARSTGMSLNAFILAAVREKVSRLGSGAKTKE